MKMLHTVQKAKRALLLLLAAVSLGAFAVPSLSVDRLVINEGEYADVAVNFDADSSPIGALQFDVQLPSELGLSGVVRNEARLDRDNFEVSLSAVEGAENTYRVLILPNSAEVIPTVEGDARLVTLKIYSAGQVDENGTTLKLQNIIASDYSIVDENGYIKPQRVDLEEVTVAVSNSVPVLTASDTVTLKAIGSEGKQPVVVSLENKFPISALEASIYLPKGLSIETKATGAPSFIYADDRLVEPISIVGNIVEAKEGDEYTKVRVVISSTSGVSFNGNSGAIFAFNVIGDDTLEDSTTVSIKDIVVSTTGAVAIEVDPVEVAIVNEVMVARKALAKETYDALLPQLNAVADNYAAVLAEIATYPTEAAKAVAIGEDSQAIADGIEAVKQALAQELAAATLSNEDGAWTDKINALQAQVDALAEKAKDTNVAAIYGDSKVSIIEYTNMVDIILEKTPAPAADSIEFLKYDVNGDGVINSSDIRPMVELIIEQNKVKN
jgi:hypothetical protein